LRNEFPFYLPFVANLKELEFRNPVTFFVGENGSGKSTLLETLACASNLPTIGSNSPEKDTTLNHVRVFSNYLRLSWRKKIHRGFFLRAEDFFGFAKRIDRTKQELRKDYDLVEEEYSHRSEFAKNQAKMAYARELHGLHQRYGEGLDNQSHGESFLKLFQARFAPKGIYLLDEPEAPLSPLRQLAFLSILNDMVRQGSQYIIATHSPIIMAYPGAEIWSFDEGFIHSVDYDKLEHVTLTRAFLNDPAAYLTHLLNQNEANLKD
jgi:predicted ATPase